MSLLVATQITAAATAVLALFAIVTAVFAFLAFRKQSAEVATLERQATDQQELTRQQGELLQVQAGQLDLQQQQLDEQRKVNEQQASVLELQAKELQESLDERKRDREQRHRAQASRVFISEEHEGYSAAYRRGAPEASFVTAKVTNTSDQPIYNVALRWHRGSASHGDPNPEPVGTMMPGDSVARTQNFPPGTNMAVSGAVVRFHDASGVEWLRRPDGGLAEQ
jgi:hypothetical protein